MIILGLTGSLGMGKSTTAKMFAEAGVLVHDADAAVHRLYEGEAVSLIEAAFPGSTAGGKVDRGKLGQRVIGNAAAMRKLEAIVHPLVRKAEERFLAEAARAGATVAVLDIPLLFETGGDKRCDAVVVVSAPPGTQRARLSTSGICLPASAWNLASVMPGRSSTRARADFIVDSGQGYEAARAQVREILAQVAKMAPKRN